MFGKRRQDRVGPAAGVLRGSQVSMKAGDGAADGANGFLGIIFNPPHVLALEFFNVLDLLVELGLDRFAFVSVLHHGIELPQSAAQVESRLGVIEAHRYFQRHPEENDPPQYIAKFRLVAKVMAVPARRFMRSRRVSFLAGRDGDRAAARLLRGQYQSPILVQWQSADRQQRRLDISIVKIS